MEKARRVLGSRKFWATFLGVVLVCVLWATAQVDGYKVVEIAALLVAVYTGSVALEDGLRGLIDTIFRESQGIDTTIHTWGPDDN